MNLVINCKLIRNLATRELPSSGLVPVGHHTYCRGDMYVGPSNKDNNALRCSLCYLRIEFPKTVTTYGELRNYCDRMIKVRDWEANSPHMDGPDNLF